MRIIMRGNLDKGEYAEMERENGKWYVTINGELIFDMPDGPEYKQLGRQKYRLLGIGNDQARVIRYADLHRHSDNSLLDGMTQVKDMVEHTEYAGALTDHGNLYGFLEYYNAMRDANKHPIIGFEAYMENMDRELKGRHVILLAKNNTGVFNLFKLTSESFNYFKRRPHVTWEMLRKYHEGVICLSACLGGVIPTLLLEGNYEKAKLATEQFIKIFGKEDFYIELQRHRIADEDRIQGQLIRLAQEYGLKTVATTDSHYPNKEDANAHEVLLCIGAKKTMDDPTRMKFAGTGYHLHTSEEMEELFSDMPEALDNTLDLAEKCVVELKLNDVNLPNYTIPRKFATPMDYMEHLTKEGYKEHFAGTPHENDPVYRERLDYELNMIRQMGFASYFIIVWDFINYCRTNNIYVGPGRGSAAGSLVAYCLRITDLDPIKYNLLFERFLNPERVSWPDIDTDIEFSRRPEVIQYITKKYGAENVCRIVTFGTLAAKQAVKDVGRCLGFPPSYTAHLSDMIPKGPKMSIDLALKESIDFQNAYKSDADAKRIIDIAMRLEGNKRHASQHACGLVIAPSTVSNFLPTSMEKDAETGEKGLTSQVTMAEVEALSLIKMDLLGLKNMGVIHEVVDSITRTRGVTAVLKQLNSQHSDIRYQDIPLDDRATYQMLARGNTGAVFQLESEGMTKLIQQMFEDIDTLPENRLGECFERLIAAVALYRPGPMDYIPNYIAGMRDVHNIHYLTPELESILRPTYGVIVYQEQVMQIVQKLAGYSLGRADLVRKAMGKKKQKVMDAEKQVFIYGNKEEYESGKDQSYAPGCVANGISEDIAKEIWGQMADFAKYAFNRSHAACYAFLSCITAYMKCYWPEEFYAAQMDAFVDNSDKVKTYLGQATRLGIKLLPPNVNRSSFHFVPEDGAIRFGLGGISGMKSLAVAIEDERSKNGPFTDFQNLYERLADAGQKLGQANADGLIYSGALSDFSSNKLALSKQFPLIETNYKSNVGARMMNQICLFSAEEMKVPMPEITPLSEKEEMIRENKALGMYLTHHPADVVLSKHVALVGYVSLPNLANTTQSQRAIATAGMVSNMRKFYTKKGDPMCSFTLDTKFASIPAVVFPSDMQNCGAELREGAVVGVYADYMNNTNRDGMQLIINKVFNEQSLMSSLYNPFVVLVQNREEQDKVVSFVKKHPGECPVILEAGGKRYPLRTGVELTAETTDFLNNGFKLA